MQQDHMQAVLEIVSPRISIMQPGEISDCEGLVDPGLWGDVPPRERRYVFGRPISMLVMMKKVPLEFVGFNRKRHNLYRKL